MIFWSMFFLPEEHKIILDGLENHLTSSGPNAWNIKEIYEKWNLQYEKLKPKMKKKRKSITTANGICVKSRHTQWEKYGHKLTDPKCPENNEKALKGGKCYNCGKNGHRIVKCKKKKKRKREGKSSVPSLMRNWYRKKELPMMSNLKLCMQTYCLLCKIQVWCVQWIGSLFMHSLKIHWLVILVHSVTSPTMTNGCTMLVT